MIDPITAISAATAAFNTVKKFVEAGKELEDVATHLGKWYTAASDLNRAEQQAKNPPMFKKLFAGGSVEEEALAIIMHQKKLKEQEYDLKIMLNWRYGHNTWQEMIQLRRKIRKERQETLYKQQERRAAFFEGLAWIAVFILFVGIVGGGFYFIGIINGSW